MTSEDLWRTAENCAVAHGLQRNNLIYGIIQDHSLSEASLLIRNVKDEDIGSAYYPTGKRKRRMVIDNKHYTIEFPLRMNTTAILREEGSQEIIASYLKKSWSSKHEFEIPGFGKLVSRQPFLNLKASFEYLENGKIVGIVQNISSTRKIGRVAILPENIPMHIRSFILSV